MRTDIHRPSAVIVSDYEVLAVPVLYTEENLIEGGETLVCEMEAQSDRYDELGRPSSSTWAGHREGQCDHCGARVKYEAVLHHVPAGDIITVGKDCANRFFNVSWTFRQMRLDTAARRDFNRAKAIQSFPNVETALDWALTGDGVKVPFAHKVAEGVVVKGYSLTEKQAIALVACFEKSLQTPTYKTGRQTFRGVIVKCTAQEDSYASSRYHTAYKFAMTIQREDGVKVYGSVPSDLSPSRPYQAEFLVGMEIELTATIEAVSVDFARFSRPAKARFLNLPAVREGVAPYLWEKLEAPAAPKPEPPAAPAEDAPVSDWAEYAAALAEFPFDTAEDRAEALIPLYAARNARTEVRDLHGDDVPGEGKTGEEARAHYEAVESALIIARYKTADPRFAETDRLERRSRDLRRAERTAQRTAEALHGPGAVVVGGKAFPAPPKPDADPADWITYCGTCAAIAADGEAPSDPAAVEKYLKATVQEYLDCLNRTRK